MRRCTFADFGWYWLWFHTQLTGCEPKPPAKTDRNRDTMIG
jgi:hypothetical protein